jgi:pimeloyl-ACP methyl ester carboxylesterase
MKPAVLAGLATGLAIPAYGVYRRYRRDMNAARARLATVDRHVVSTPWGAVEYAETGSGAPVLVVHGIYHNCVGGLLSVRDLFRDRRVVAPSRFGYLGSSMPPNATPAAQADAFAALLDTLDIDQIDVIGLSAGATSALQLALRHPRRVKHRAVLHTLVTPTEQGFGSRVLGPHGRRQPDAVRLRRRPRIHRAHDSL